MSYNRNAPQNRLLRAVGEDDAVALASLLKETEEAHAASGAFPGCWPQWYAAYLLGKAIGTSCVEEAAGANDDGDIFAVVGALDDSFDGVGDPPG